MATNRCKCQSQKVNQKSRLYSTLIWKDVYLNINFFLNIAEQKLPQLYKFSGGDIGEDQAIFQKFPDNPLFVQTTLMENEYGEIRPYTTNENKAWAASEKIRIHNKSLGMQN